MVYTWVLAILKLFYFKIFNILKIDSILEESFDIFKDMKRSLNIFFYAKDYDIYRRHFDKDQIVFKYERFCTYNE